MNRLMDIEDYHVYTEKLSVGYVDMTRTDLATDVDKHYNVDKWARFFRSKTWEEVRMLAEEYPIIEEAASNLRRLSEEERFRLQQEAWEDRQRRVNGLRMLLDQAKEEASKANERATEAEAQIDEAKNQAAKADERAEIYRQQLIEAGIIPKD